MTKTSNGTSGIPSSLPIANAPATPLPMLKQETLELTTTTAIVSALECLEALLTNGNTQPHQQFINSTCHFCGKIGHTMVQGTYMKLEQMIQQGKVHWNAEGKIILPSGTMIPNYFSKQLYMERIKEWHRLNPGQIVTGRLSSSANPNPEQVAMQQSLIHKVMQQDITMGQALSKEEQIKALERELFALRRPGKKFDGIQVPCMAYQPANNTTKATPPTSNTSVTSSSSDLTSAPAAKPADKGKASEHTIINEQPPSLRNPLLSLPFIHFPASLVTMYPLLTGILLLPTELMMTNPALAYLYAMASDISDLSLPPHSYLVSADTFHPLILGQTLPLDTHVTDTTPTYVNIPFPTQFVTNEPPKQRGVQVKKKYKPVASHVSENFQIEHQIIGNLLVTIPQLNPNPPPFIPTKRFTSEQQAKLVKDHDTGFLTTGEINILVNMVTKQEKVFAWKYSE
ncbi:hypothetical protein E4T56_gene1465 [Termitomyces sp. T112]|nr:hypothetical protein E4T56_gene1465 [Termitomyces sp. T112]